MIANGTVLNEFRLLAPDQKESSARSKFAQKLAVNPIAAMAMVIPHTRATNHENPVMPTMAIQLVMRPPALNTVRANPAKRYGAAQELPP